MSNPVYRRVLLKLSGESLGGEGKSRVNISALRRIVGEIVAVNELGVQVAIVVGGGNFIRGSDWSKKGLSRVTGDQMGMLATVMNGLALHDLFQERGVASQLMTAFAVEGIGQVFTQKQAEACLEKGEAVIFVGGTGNPFFSTDTAACLRAAEVGAELVLKGTRVAGIFDADPEQKPDSKLYSKLTYDEVLDMRLAVMDFSAIFLCREHSIPLRVFDITKQGIFKDIVCGADVGTMVSCE